MTRVRLPIAVRIAAGVFVGTAYVLTGLLFPRRGPWWDTWITRGSLLWGTMLLVAAVEYTVRRFQGARHRRTKRR